MKTAIVTDFLVQLGGAELVTKELASLFPNADIYSLMAGDKVLKKYFEGRKVFQHPKLKSSRLRRKYYRKLLPLYPTYIEDFDFREYDLVISSSYLFAKGILCNPGTIHISYVHTPMRQAWTKYHDYLYNENDVGRFARPILRFVMNYLRIWDLSSSNRVNHFIANSSVVKKRISEIYQREAEVIHPPIKVSKFRNKYAESPKEDYYITVGRLVPYKRVDLLVKAFNKMSDQKLLIIGAGNDLNRLQKLTTSDNIEFLGYVDDNKKNKLVAKAKAFLFAAEEDFGMSPVEAMALGTPVIGYHKGGTQEYIKEHVNGLFFKEQTVESLTSAIASFNPKAFDRQVIADSVRDFDEQVFHKKMKAFISEKMDSN